MKYALQPAARADLTNIWLYTAERWGVQQADLYTASINQKIIDTSAYPQAGSPLGDVKDDYRKLVAGNHRIIYRFTDEQLFVVRILHEQQDVPPDADL